MVYPLRRTLRLEAPRSWQTLNLAELWEYRELLFFFVWRDVKVRYKQTVLGALWAVIQPLTTTFAFAILFAASIVTYRDVRYVITFIMQLWLFGTPVLYPITMIPAKWHLLYAINPMAGMVSGFRASVLGGPFPMAVILVSSVSAAVLCTAAVRYFVQVERRFADVI